MRINRLSFNIFILYVGEEKKNTIDRLTCKRYHSKRLRNIIKEFLIDHFRSLKLMVRESNKRC